MDFDGSSSESDNVSDEASAMRAMSFAEDLCNTLIAQSFIADRLIITMMNWLHHIQLLLRENLFHVKYWMSIDSFNQLLDLLSTQLHFKEKYAIIPGMEPCVIMLHCAIHFLDGGSYHDVHATMLPSFFCLVWHAIDAIPVQTTVIFGEVQKFQFLLVPIMHLVEMALGLLVTKWCILHTLTNVKLGSLKILLSNYCIDNREPSIALQHSFSYMQKCSRTNSTQLQSNRCANCSKQKRLISSV